LSKKTLLLAFVDTVRAHIAYSSEMSDVQWDTFAQAHGLVASVKPDVEALIDWLPEACEALATVLQDPLETRENKILASVAMNYVLMPYDLIPDEEKSSGRYGFLDDAILVGECMHAMLTDSPPVIREVHARVADSLQRVEEELPLGVKEMLNRQLDSLGNVALSIEEYRREEH